MKHENRRQQSPTTKKGRYLPWQTRFLCASMKWPRSWGCPCPNPNFRIKVPSFISTRQNAWIFQRLGEPVEFRADQLIAMPGCYPRYSYFLKTGRVIAGIVNSSSSQRLMLSFEESSLLLEQYQLTGKPCDLYYRAVTPCTAQMIPCHDMTQAMRADFSVTLDGPCPFGRGCLRRRLTPPPRSAHSFWISLWPSVRKRQARR